MAKQFIRHLEFYGFPDQNGYSSSFANVDVDLSNLRKKDKIHDKEIRCLANEKADKKDLLELSATVETFIDTQSQYNQAVVDELSGITSDIEKLKEIDNRYGEQLSALTEGVNNALCGVQNLGNRVDDIEEDITELSGKVETFSAETQNKLDEIDTELEKKFDKEEAEETFAKKEDVPTKDELEEILEDYASKEWVEEQGYLDQEEGDARYAKKETVDALNDRVNSAVTDLNTKIYTVSGDLQSFSSSTNTRMGILETNFETLRGEVNRKINEISGTVEGYDARITQNANDIDALEDELARKANQADLEVLQNTVSNLSDLVDTKVSKTEFETYKSLIVNQFNDMDDKKADKTALNEALGAIEDTNDRIDQEISDREAGDFNLQGQIDAINAEIVAIKEQAVDYGERIQALENGLVQEISDRQQADLDLIGSSADTKDHDTIWGAKAFAKETKRQAINEANTYTNQEVASLRSDVNAQFNQVDQALSAKADKTYVDDVKGELEDTIDSAVTSAVSAEEDRATQQEANLLNRIIQNASAITENDDAIDNIANRLNAITAWDGTDPDEYVNTGNGVLDVLHREFHQLIDTLTQKGILP